MPSKQRVDAILCSATRTPEEELARTIVPKLAARSYHLPGNNPRQDYFQYLFNNHPLFGICCHHRLHPLHTSQRFIALLGSFAFGVAITNAVFFWFASTGRDDEARVFEFNYTDGYDNSQQFTVTHGLAVLLTVGSGSNALFDRFVWTLSACACCRAGGRFESSSRVGCCGGCCQGFGRYLAVFFVVSMVALASCVAVARASLEHDDDEGGGEGTRWPIYYSGMNNATAKETLADLLDFDEFDMQDYSFLKGYSLEFAFSLFVYTPLFETLLFSGILGCYSVPLLGGRPYAMKQEAKKQQSSAKQQQSMAV